MTPIFRTYFLLTVHYGISLCNKNHFVCIALKLHSCAIPLWPRYHHGKLHELPFRQTDKINKSYLLCCCCWKLVHLNSFIGNIAFLIKKIWTFWVSFVWKAFCSNISVKFDTESINVIYVFKQSIWNLWFVIIIMSIIFIQIIIV